MKHLITGLLLILSLNVAAQLDSLAYSFFYNTPAGKSSFAYTHQVGIKIGKQTNNVRYSVSYGIATQQNRWFQFYDNENSRWTTNALVLHNYSDSLPAESRRGEVRTRSHAISLGWSNEFGDKSVRFYGGIRGTAFLNSIDILQKESDAYLASGEINDAELQQGQSLDEVTVRYVNNVITSDTKLNSIIPALNLEAGAVFTMGSSFKVIPMLTIGIHADDSRIYSGNLYPKETIIDADVRTGIQFSYLF